MRGTGQREGRGRYRRDIVGQCRVGNPFDDGHDSICTGALDDEWTPTSSGASGTVVNPIDVICLRSFDLLIWQWLRWSASVSTRTASTRETE
ncbi:hypothetical protein GOARA_064_01060 [Gordonia araii NBRC 100433]|uniref:Uncharacterized protein n=1 Tax=Gordonia araii NBRC 100433 TaxID=1073574 RepID=G7H5H9_9ACTN|nr:hypothetical protein GOARA_064_01060 [Gordonia araii NBRC 100433]